MLLDQVFNTSEHVKTIFVRKNGKLKRVTKPCTYTREPDTTIKNKPLFPIVKDRSKPEGGDHENKKN